ncbi:MAG: helix-turn-helix domain-containing protein [Clostridiales bacterium]|nr:helix-turn-helix domain-containing protein [Clostridiales bacterium]
MDNSLFQEKWFTDGYSISLSAYYLKTWVGFQMMMHSHKHSEIMYVTKGKCTIKVEDQTYCLVNGDFILIDADIPHRIVMDQTQQCKMINIEFGFTKEHKNIPTMKQLLGEDFFQNKLFEDAQSHYVFKDNSHIYSYLKSLITELYSNNSPSNRIIQMQVAQLLFKLVDLYTDSTSRRPVQSIIHIRKAIDYMSNHYFDEIKVSQVAKSAGLNANYLQRIFKKHTHKTVIAYLNDIRIKKAKELLANTDIAIIDICLYVGINSRQYFTYLFKKHEGVTPKQYRNSFSEEFRQN